MAIGNERVGILLFRNIFTIAPEAKPLFKFLEEIQKAKQDIYNSPQLKAHGSKVVSTVGKAVQLLEELDTLVPILQKLGKYHTTKGI